jgi:hypothetical protein
MRAWGGGRACRYAFIEFETAQQARQAVKAGDGFQLDKAHVFACNLFPDIERLSSISAQYTPTAAEAYQERVRACPSLPPPHTGVCADADDGAGSADRAGRSTCGSG